MDPISLKTEARRLLHFDQAAQAVALLQDGMARTGADAEAHGLMGAALSRTGNDAAAVSHFEQAVRLDPFKAPNHFNLGVAYEKLGRLDWALEGYRQALVRDPNFEQAVAAYYRLAPQIASRPVAEETVDDGRAAQNGGQSAAGPLPQPPMSEAPRFEGPRVWSAAPQGVQSAYGVTVAAMVLGCLGFGLVYLGYSQSPHASDDNTVFAVFSVLFLGVEAIQACLLLAHKRAWPAGWTIQLVVAVIGLLGIPLYTIMYAVILMRWFKPEVKAWYGVDS